MPLQVPSLTFYTSVTIELTRARRSAASSGIGWQTLRASMALTLQRGGQADNEVALQQHLGADAHGTESLAALQGVLQLFGQALQKEFWVRLNSSMREEQLACWAAWRKRADLAEAAQRRSQRNADVAALPGPARNKTATPKMRQCWQLEDAARPKIPEQVAQLCFPEHLAGLKSSLRKVWQRLSSGTRRAVLINRFGEGMLCLPSKLEQLESVHLSLFLSLSLSLCSYLFFSSSLSPSLSPSPR